MEELKNKIEAVLFITGRSMSVEEIASFCNVGSVGSVKDALQSLREEYNKRDSALEIISEDNRFKLNIKRPYSYLSTSLVSSAELDAATQATLAIIAYKQPALQADIIKMRGNSAYDHIKTLKDMEFVTSEKSGRTRALKLAPKFYDYFDVVEEQLQQKFKDAVEKQQTLVEEKKEAVVEQQPVDVQTPPAVQEEPAKRKKRVQKSAEPSEDVVEVVEEKPSAIVEMAPVLEVERSPAERLRQLNADDFGS